MTTAEDALKALDLAMQDVDPACQGDGRFVLDDQPAHTLRYICNECPLIELCRAYAKAAKPPAGVWAGRRWYYPKTRRSKRTGA